VRLTRHLGRIPVLAILILAVPAAGRAQGGPPRPAASALRSVETASVLRPSLASILADTVPRPHRPTYWLEGALVGGALAGIALARFAWSVCSDPDSGASGPCWDNTLLGALVGVASGGTLGALAGGLIEKSKAQPDTAALEKMGSSVLHPSTGQTQTQARRAPAAGVIFEAAALGPLRTAVVRDSTDSLPRRIRPTHWKEGAVIGGLALAAGFAVLFAGVCSAGAEVDTDCSGAPVTGALVGVIPGGIIGALIGGQFPKEEEGADPERPEQGP
jgi:hypothetical protein